MIKTTIAALALLVLLSSGVQAKDNAGGIGRVPGIDVGLGIQTFTVFDNKGGISSGYVNREAGTLFMSGPDNKITLGYEDSAGNIVINEYGGDDDD